MKRQIVVCLVCSLLGGIVAVAVTRLAADSPREPLSTSPAIALHSSPSSNPQSSPPGVDLIQHVSSIDPNLTPEERVNIAVYENVNMSVVNISTRGTRGESFFMLELPAEGSGSGSVLDKAGHILTNNHVVEGAKKIEVTLYDGSSYLAERIGVDNTNDIAIVRIDAPPDLLHPVRLGDSSQLRVGQRVFAIGNPFGLERTLTTGVISSVNRTLPGRNHRTLKSIIQIDAAINPGNSGGPLLDTSGRLIGINMAIASRTGQSSGVGFAIPSSTIARIVPQLVERGRVIRPDIGIDAVYQAADGLRIAKLAEGGAAQKAGLRGPRVTTRRHGLFVFESIDRNAADMIVGVDGKPISTVDDFLTEIESRRPGDEVAIHVLRDGQEIRVPVRLAEAGQ